MLKAEKIRGLIQQAIPCISSGKGQPIALLIGMTGSGKSTTTNYLLGYGMRKIKGGHAQPVEATAPAKMGDGAESVTLYPMAYKSPENLVFCDTPGLIGNHGKEENVCVSVITEMMVKSASAISAVIVVVEYDLIFTRKGEGLKDLMLMLSKLFKNPGRIAGSLLFIITKWPSDFEKQDLKAEIGQLILAQQNKYKKLGETLQNLSDQASSGWFDEKELVPRRKQANEIYRIMMILELIQANFDENVFVVDVFDHGESRLRIAKRIKQCKNIDKSEFDFGSYNPDRMQFNEIMSEAMVEAISLASQLQTIPIQLRRSKSDSEEAKQRMEFYAEQQKSLFESKSLDLQQRPMLFAALREKIKGISKLKEQLGEEQKVIAAEAQNTNSQLIALDCKDPVCHWTDSVDTDYSLLAGVIDHLPDVIDYIPVPDPTVVLSIGAKQVAKYALKGVIFAGKALANYLYEGEHFCYEGIPFLFDRRYATQGEFINCVSKPSEGRFSVVYKNDFFKERKATVEIYVEKRCIPVNQAQIKILKNELAQQKERLSENASEQVRLQAEMRMVEKTDRQLQQDDISSILSLKVEYDLTIDRLQKSITEYRAQYRILESKLEDVQAALLEKMPFFVVIKDILQITEEHESSSLGRNFIERMEFLCRQLPSQTTLPAVLLKDTTSSDGISAERKKDHGLRVSSVKSGHSPAVFKPVVRISEVEDVVEQYPSSSFV